MPIVHSKFSPNLLLSNGHIQTLFSRVNTCKEEPKYTREKLITTDGDFIDLDWSYTGSKRLIIVTHGLEGSSRSPYVKNFVAIAQSAGWDVLAWNLRGCGGTPNQKLQSYHSGSSDDLQLVFSHALFKKIYQQICLVGFSIGGNITLKFLGEQGDSVNGLISGATAISVPCDLASSAKKLSNLSNYYYLQWFLKSLKKKVAYKLKTFPDYLPYKDLKKINSFYEFDNYYTAPVHGFRTAEEYYRQCSSLHYLEGIKVPTLLVNAKNDPFLAAECYPTQSANNNEFLHFEMPKSGGHVGFKAKNSKSSWINFRTIEFLTRYGMAGALDFTKPLRAA